MGGRLGGEIAQIGAFDVAGRWTTFELPHASGDQVVYLEVLESGTNRTAWSAPIWIERIDT